jgi:hypothetical protein
MLLELKYKQKKKGIIYFYIKLKSMKSKKIIFLTLGLILLFIFNCTAVSAAEFKFISEEKSVNVGAGEIIKNLYTAGNIISINGEIKKDLYAAGNVITVGGSVEDNLCSIGGTVIVKGDVGGNVHTAAGSVVIEGNIAEDLFIAGGNILIASSATIGGDLVIGGGVVDIEGPIMGNVLIGGGEVNINSKISGFVEITADNLMLGEFAVLENDLKYSAPKEAVIHKDAKILGTVDFNKGAVKGADKSYAAKVLFGILSTLFLIKVVTSILVGLVLIYFFRRTIKSVVRESFNNKWGSLGKGFAVMFLTPIAGLILAITVIGLYLAGLLALAYILLIMLSSVLASIAFGSWFVKVFKKKKDYSVGWIEVVVGVIILKIICYIPFVGWLVCFWFMLISLGSLSGLLYKEIKKNKHS